MALLIHLFVPLVRKNRWCPLTSFLSLDEWVILQDLSPLWGFWAHFLCVFICTMRRSCIEIRIWLLPSASLYPTFLSSDFWPHASIMNGRNLALFSHYLFVSVIFYEAYFFILFKFWRNRLGRISQLNISSMYFSWEVALQQLMLNSCTSYKWIWSHAICIFIF